MTKILTALIAALIFIGLFIGALDGWLLLLGFGIVHAHISSSVPAIGWWVAWPLGVIFGLLRAKSTNTKETTT